MTALPFIQTFFAELVDRGGQAPAMLSGAGLRNFIAIKRLFRSVRP